MPRKYPKKGALLLDLIDYFEVNLLERPDILKKLQNTNSAED